VFSNLDLTGIPDPRRFVYNEASESDDDDESPGRHHSYQNYKQRQAAESDDDDVRAVSEGSDSGDSDVVEEDCNREPSVQILKQKRPDIDEIPERLRKQKLDNESRQPRTQFLELIRTSFLLQTHYHYHHHNISIIMGFTYTVSVTL
jgi:hypothetical protein